MTSVSFQEKRLKQLKQQLFGKEQPLTSEATRNKIQETNKFQITKEAKNLIHSSVSTSIIDSVSLKQDLFKIAAFSVAALAIQLSLFFASKQGLINLFR